MRVFFLPWNSKNPYQQNLADALRDHGVEVTGCEPRKLLPVLSLLWRYGRPDVLHLHWVSGFMVSRFRLASLLTSAVFLLELLVFRALGVRIVWTVHNLVEHKRRDVALELQVAHLVAMLCDRLIVHSEHGRRMVDHSFGVREAQRRISVVAHGNYIDNYPDFVNRDAARKRLGIASDSMVYLCFGMLQPYKGIEDLIDAFRALDVCEATLLLVGSCRDEALRATIELAAVADDRIRPILRFVPAEEVQHFMRAADAVVLPFSDVFTSGSVVLAMGFHRALVVPRVGCLPDYLSEDGGILYAPGRENLAVALREIAVADRATMGRHNLRAAQNLDWPSIAAHTAVLYKSASLGCEPPSRPARNSADVGEAGTVRG